MTAVVIAVTPRWVTVSLGWRERRRVHPGDVIEIISPVAPLDARRPVEFASARLREASARQRSARDAARVRRVLTAS